MVERFFADAKRYPTGDHVYIWYWDGVDVWALSGNAWADRHSSAFSYNELTSMLEFVEVPDPRVPPIDEGF